MKAKKSITQKLMEAERRKKEIEAYGKLVSLRPSVIFKNKKAYKRNKKVNYED